MTVLHVCDCCASTSVCAMALSFSYQLCELRTLCVRKQLCRFVCVSNAMFVCESMCCGDACVCESVSGTGF